MWPDNLSAIVEAAGSDDAELRSQGTTALFLLAKQSQNRRQLMRYKALDALVDALDRENQPSVLHRILRAIYNLLSGPERESYAFRRSNVNLAGGPKLIEMLKGPSLWGNYELGYWSLLIINILTVQENLASRFSALGAIPALTHAARVASSNQLAQRSALQSLVACVTSPNPRTNI